jgi:hypothetical protein
MSLDSLLVGLLKPLWVRMHMHTACIVIMDAFPLATVYSTRRLGNMHAAAGIQPALTNDNTLLKLMFMLCLTIPEIG